MAILDCSSSILWVANIGDSRGVLCNSSSVPIGEVMPLSYDHKPSQVSFNDCLLFKLRLESRNMLSISSFFIVERTEAH